MVQVHDIGSLEPGARVKYDDTGRIPSVESMGVESGLGLSKCRRALPAE